MSNLTIETDNEPRPLVAHCELPEDVQEDFEYAADDDFTPRFVQYGDDWYDAQDAQRITTRRAVNAPMGWDWLVEPDHPFAKWHMVISEGFFCGTLFRFVENDYGDEMVVVGRYTS